MIIQTGKLNFSAGEVEVCGNHRETVEPRRDDLFRDTRMTYQSLVKALSIGVFHPERARGVSLWIEINQKHPLPLRRKTGREVHRSGRFSDATFLVCNCEQLHSDTSLGLRDLQANEKYVELRQKAAKIIRTEENKEGLNRR